METATAAYNVGVSRQKLEFAYDVQGRRISKKVSNWTGSAWVLASSTLFLYDGWNLIVELNAMSANAAIRTYTWGTDLSGSLQGAGGVGGLLFTLVQAPTSSLHAPCYDGNGNIIAYVDLATGVTSATYEYNAFGEILIADGVARKALPFRFSSKYVDSETDLLYYGLRYYSPSMGRWLNRDPMEEDGGINIYGFVLNSPTNLVDPLGLYDAPGHFDSPYIDAQAAGYSPSDAFKLAYWTQYPDLDPNYDAMRAPSQNRMAVREYLHSLTGGDAQKLREYLICLLKSGEFKLLSERGILLHAFGDTYTHSQTQRDGQERLDGPQIGHLFRGHNADYIASDPAKYGRYVNDMYDVLVSTNGGATTNPALRDGLINAASSLAKPYPLDFFFNGTQDRVEATALRNLPGGYSGLFRPERRNQKPLSEADVGPAPNMQSMIDRIKNGVAGCCLKK